MRMVAEAFERRSSGKIWHRYSKVEVDYEDDHADEVKEVVRVREVLNHTGAEYLKYLEERDVQLRA